MPVLSLWASEDFQVQKYSITLDSEPMALDGYLGYYLYSAPLGRDEVVMGWDHYTDAHIRIYNEDFSDYRKEFVIEDHVLQDIETTEDGSILVLAVYHPDASLSLANAFKSPLPMDLIKYDRNGRKIFQTRITGGEGISEGKTWYAWMPSIASADVKQGKNGNYGVFLEVSHNFGATGTHQTDLFVMVDKNGNIIENSRQFQTVSHSNELHLLAGEKDNEFVSITVGDMYPFGFTFINRLSGEYEVIWPVTDKDDLQRMKDSNQYTTGAGGIERFMNWGNEYVAVTTTALPRDLPIDYMAGDPYGILLLNMNREGEVLTKSWLKQSSADIDKAFAAPRGESILTGWVQYDDELEGLGVPALMEVDRKGNILAGPQRVEDAEIYYHSYFFNLPSGDVAWTVMKNASTVDIYRVKGRRSASPVAAAADWDDGTILFWKDNQFSLYDFPASKTVSGLPLPLNSGTWPGHPGVFPDAVLNYKNGDAYLFSGAQYYRMDIKNGSVYSGGPGDISRDWPGVSFPAIDGAFRTGDKIYLFYGNQYIRFNGRTNQADRGYPKTINPYTWPGLGFSSIDAVFERNGKAYFFSGDEYVRFDIALDRADDGYPQKIQDGFPGIF